MELCELLHRYPEMGTYLTKRASKTLLRSDDVQMAKTLGVTVAELKRIADDAGYHIEPYVDRIIQYPGMVKCPLLRDRHFVKICRGAPDISAAPTSVLVWDEERWDETTGVIPGVRCKYYQGLGHTLDPSATAPRMMGSAPSTMQESEQPKYERYNENVMDTDEDGREYIKYKKGEPKLDEYGDQIPVYEGEIMHQYEQKSKVGIPGGQFYGVFVTTVQCGYIAPNEKPKSVVAIDHYGRPIVSQEDGERVKADKYVGWVQTTRENIGLLEDMGFHLSRRSYNADKSRFENVIGDSDAMDQLESYAGLMTWDMKPKGVTSTPKTKETDSDESRADVRRRVKRRKTAPVVDDIDASKTPDIQTDSYTGEDDRLLPESVESDDDDIQEDPILQQLFQRQHDGDIRKRDTFDRSIPRPKDQGTKNKSLVNRTLSIDQVEEFAQDFLAEEDRIYEEYDENEVKDFNDAFRIFIDEIRSSGVKLSKGDVDAIAQEVYVLTAKKGKKGLRPTYRNVDPKELALVDAARQGNQGAWDELISKNYNNVVGLMVSEGCNQEMAHDVAQSTFVNAYAKIDTFKGNSSFKTWLFMIAHNQKKDYLRKQKLREDNQISLDAPHGNSSEGDPGDDGNDSFEANGPNAIRSPHKMQEQMEWEDTIAPISDAISNMPEHHRDAWLMYHTFPSSTTHPWNREMVADALGMTDGLEPGSTEYKRKVERVKDAVGKGNNIVNNQMAPLQYLYDPNAKPETSIPFKIGDEVAINRRDPQTGSTYQLRGIVDNINPDTETALVLVDRVAPRSSPWAKRIDEMKKKNGEYAVNFPIMEITKV